MKRRFSKTIAVVTALTMVISTAMPAFADTKSAKAFPDISGHWAEGDLTEMVNRGIMGGYPDGTMKPQQSVTIAESIKLINQSLNIQGSGNVSSINYSDVKKDAWYSAEIAIAVENGYLSRVAPGDKLNPNAAATREQLSSMFAQAMKLKAQDEKVLDKFKDTNQIASALKPDMAAAVEKGLFGGYEDNTLRPKTPVVRATLAAVANRTMSDMAKTETQGIKLGANDVLVEKNGETISGKTLDTVWISPLEGTGTITLENIVAKKVVIMGKESSVVIKAAKADNTEKTRRARVGNGESKITEIEFKAPNSKLDIQSNVTVDSLKVKKEAKGSSVLGNGIVTKATISADNFKLNTVGTEFSVESGVDGVTVSGTSAPANTSGKSKSSGFDKAVVSGGGGGGGGGSVTPPSDVITGEGFKYTKSTKALDVTGNNVTITSAKIENVTEIATLTISGNNVTIDGIKVTGDTIVNGISGSARKIGTFVMPVRVAQSPVTFKGCDLAKVTMNREGVRIEFEGGKALTIVAQKSADISCTGTVAVTNFVTEASTTLSGSGLTVTKMEVKVAGVTVKIEAGKVTEIVVDQAATGTKLNLEGVTVDKIDTKSSVEIEGNGTITNIEAPAGVEVKTDIKPENPVTGGGGTVENKYNYAFRASNGTTTVSIIEKEYAAAAKMDFAAVKDVYSEIGKLDSNAINQHIDKAMPTVKKILELTDNNGKKYADTLNTRINTSQENLTVFAKGSDIANYIHDIAAETNVDTNVNSLTKELLKADLENILSDLAKLFPNESIPSKVSVKVINKDGNLVELSNRSISQAKNTIDAQLGQVPFNVGSSADSAGKEIIQVSMDNAQTTLSLNIKKMS